MLAVLPLTLPKTHPPHNIQLHSLQNSSNLAFSTNPHHPLILSYVLRSTIPAASHSSKRNQTNQSGSDWIYMHRTITQKYYPTQPQHNHLRFMRGWPNSTKVCHPLQKNGLERLLLPWGGHPMIGRGQSEDLANPKN